MSTHSECTECMTRSLSVSSLNYDDWQVVRCQLTECVHSVYVQVVKCQLTELWLTGASNSLYRRTRREMKSANQLIFYPLGYILINQITVFECLIAGSYFLRHTSSRKGLRIQAITSKMFLKSISHQWDYFVWVHNRWFIFSAPHI